MGEKHVNELTALLQHDLWIDAGREGSNTLGTFGAVEDYRTHSKKETERIISEMINASQRWPQDGPKGVQTNTKGTFLFQIGPQSDPRTADKHA